MSESLVVIADRRIMGEVRCDRRGRLAFTYDERWRSMNEAYPLSLSMPLVVGEHGHARIEPWLWGLLPDNDAMPSWLAGARSSTYRPVTRSPSSTRWARIARAPFSSYALRKSMKRSATTAIASNG